MNVPDEDDFIYVYFDIKFEKSKAGRVVIQLFKSKAPKAVENFRALCTGEKGLGKNNRPLHYKNTRIHKVIPLCMIQGGDIISGNGDSGESIYGDTFDDENLINEHVSDGIVGMINNGPNTNQSQFYITTVPCPHLEGTNVVVGRVIKGLNIIVEMSDLPRENDIPTEEILIYNCGVYKPGDLWNIEEKDGTADVYPPWPNDWETPDENSVIENAIDQIKESGNLYYKKLNFTDSERKYVKTLRYIDWYISINKNASEKVRKIKEIAMSNLAAVKLKKNLNKEALALCNQIIQRNSKNAKAYFRRANALLALKDYDLALMDFKTASRLQPKDKKIRSALSNIKQVKLNYLKKERKVFANMFD